MYTRVAQFLFFQEFPFLSLKNYFTAKCSPLAMCTKIFPGPVFYMLHVNIFIDKATRLHGYVDLSPHFGKTLPKLSRKSVP